MADNVVMIFSIFRHGDRGPLIFIPYDESRDYWKNVPAELTKKGKLEAHTLGKWYREEYGSFLPNAYCRNDVYVYSTDTDRTLMSAQCVLSGLFPPTTNEASWHPSLAWQPIPVHTNSSEHDPLYPSVEALNIDSMPDNIYHSNEQIACLDRFNKKKEMWKDWYKHYYGSDTKMTLRDVMLSGDNRKIALEKCGSITNLPTNINIHEFGASVVETVQLAYEVLPAYRPMGLSLLQFVVDAITNHIEARKSTKIYLYSVHDVTIFALLGLMKITLSRTGYCGCLTFELHELADKKYVIKLKHKIKYDSVVTDVHLYPKTQENYFELEDLKCIILGNDSKMKMEDD